MPQLRFSALLFCLLFSCVTAYKTDFSIQKYLYGQVVCTGFNEICKRAYSKGFECRCPRSRPLCVSEGTYYDAKCVPDTWLPYGRLWVQPKKNFDFF